MSKIAGIDLGTTSSGAAVEVHVLQGERPMEGEFQEA
jgi:molecular chaperone DnaK (HSP70)